MDEQVLHEEEVKTDIIKPTKYEVYLLNDDYTSFEFVVSVLMEIFNKDMIEAEQLTKEIHENGKGLAGIYVRDIAKTKVLEVSNAGNKHGYPLKAMMKEVE